MHARLALAALLLGALGCTFSPALPDQEPRILCDEDADCPVGACAVTSGRCVINPGQVRLDALTLSPPIARAGVSLEISFTVDEPLLRAPVVTPGWSGVALEADPASDPTAGRWVFRYLVQGDEPEDEPQGIDIEVEGVGERLRDVVTARFDFQPPAADIEVVGPAVEFGVRAGGRIELVVGGLREDELELEGSLELSAEGQTFAPAQITRAAVGGDLELGVLLPPELPPGVVHESELTAALTVVDAAGNEQRLEAAPIAFDLELPSATVQIPPSISTPEVQISLADLDAVSVRIAGDVVSPLGTLNATTNIEAQVTAAPGVKNIEVHLADGAGNTRVIPATTILEDGVFVTVELRAPDDKTAARPGETLVIDGVAAAGAELVSASATQGETPLTVDLDIVDGALVGSLTAPATEGLVRLEVQVERDGQLAQDAATLDVDATPPSFTLSFPEGAISAAPEGRLAITTTDIDVESLVVTGDLVAIRRAGQQVPIGEEIAFAASLDLFFSAGDGSKSVQVVARDGAGNADTETATFVVDGALVDSNPTLSPSVAIGAGGTLTVGGTVTPGATIASARAIYGGEACRVEPAAVTLGASRRLEGTITVPSNLEPCASSVVLEVIVDVDGVTSNPANSRSAPVLVDDDPPAGGPPTLTGTQLGDPGVTRSATITVAVSATEATGSGSFVILGASSDVVDGPNVDAPIPFISAQGSQTVIGSASVTLAGGDGEKNIDVVLTDGLGNASEVRSATIVLDKTPPAPAELTAVRLTERAPAGAEFDPTALDVNNTTAVEGLAGAATGAFEVKIGNGVGGFATSVVGAGGAFSEVSLPASPNHQYSVRTFDAAGNVAEVTAQLPRATAVDYTPDLPASALQVLAVDLTISGATSANSVQIDGNPAASVSPTSFRYTPAGDEPELPALAVVRARFTPPTTSFAAGSLSTQAATLSFDFTNPVVTDVVPGGATFFDGLSDLQGTASDLSVITGVSAEVRELNTGLYWDPEQQAFTSVDSLIFPVSGTTSWSITDLSYNQGPYEVSVFAVDAATNVGGLVYTFNYDDGDAAPRDLAATSAAPRLIELSWTPPPGGVDAYRLEWRSSGTPGPAPPAAEGSSPLLLPAGATSAQLSELPRDRYVVKLTGVRSTGTEGFVEAGVASRDAIDVLSSAAVVNAVAADRSGNVVACLSNNTAAYSADGGASWQTTPPAARACSFAAVQSGLAVLVAPTGEALRVELATGIVADLQDSKIANVLAVGIDSAGGVIVAGEGSYAVRGFADADWTLPALASATDLRAIRTTPSGAVAAAGVSGGDGVIIYGGDGVASLELLHTESFIPFNGVGVNEANVVLACGGGRVLRTQDLAVFAPAQLPEPITCDDLDLDGGFAGMIGEGVIVRSVDSGRTWSFAVDGLGVLTEVSVGKEGTLCAARDGPVVSCVFPNGAAKDIEDDNVDRRFRHVRVFSDGTAVIGGNTGVGPNPGLLKRYGP